MVQLRTFAEKKALKPEVFLDVETEVRKMTADVLQAWLEKKKKREVGKMSVKEIKKK